MRLQVLISTMNQTGYGLLEKMNIQSDAVVINQCDCNSRVEFQYREYRIIWICTTERGVGRSRNRAILEANAEILLFADDDVVYEEEYVNTVIDLFKAYPDIMLAVFNFTSLNPNRPETIVLKEYRLHIWNCLKFGAFRIAVKREKLLKKNVFFSLLFGGGAKYQAGEDNLFITDILRSGGKGLATSKRLGTVAQEESTWFTGYTEKYYSDRGALFSAMYGRLAFFFLLIFEFRKIGKGFVKRLCVEFKGASKYWR